MRVMCMGEVTEERFGAGKLVLLVEDNEINAEIAMLQLREMGFEIDWVVNGARAVENFENSEPFHYNLVVTDIMMPVMDGLEATRIIRNLERPDARKVPIIAITANTFPEDTKDSLENGASRVITKPYSRRFFEDTVRELLQA